MAPQDPVLLTGRDPDARPDGRGRGRRRAGDGSRRGSRARRPRRRRHRGPRRRAGRGRHRLLQRRGTHEPGCRPGRRGRCRRRDQQPRDHPHAARLRAPPAPGRPADRRRQRPRHARQARRPGRRPFRREPPNDLDAVDALVADWRRAVHDGRAEQEGYGTWLNIPSKVAQVAAVRAVARERRAADLAEDKLVMALCPGLIDTAASRPWFDGHEPGPEPGRGRALARRARARRRVRRRRSTASSSSSAGSSPGSPACRCRGR